MNPGIHVRPQYDIVVAGAGTGGISAALQSARMGSAVLLLEESDWIGGQTAAAGVTSQDYATPILKQSGIYREFCERLEAYYKARGKSPQVAYFLGSLSGEPTVMREILNSMLEESGKNGVLDLATGSNVLSIHRKGNVVTGAKIDVAGRVVDIECSILVDATEWGDVIPLAGVDYRTGNGSRDSHEDGHEVQHLTWTAVIRKYEGGVPNGLVMEQKPVGFDAIVGKFKNMLKAGDDPVQLPPYAPQSRPWVFSTFVGYRAMPDGKFPDEGLRESSMPIPARSSDEYRSLLDKTPIRRSHLNFGNDYPVYIRDIEDLESRKKALREAQLRTLQLLYYIQHELGQRDWSVADDEGYDTPRRRREVDGWLAEQPELTPFREVLLHFSAIPYVRESRRIIGLHTLTAGEIERHPRSPRRFKDVVSLGDYMIDLHGSKQLEYLETDLDPLNTIPTKTGERGYGPFGIPLGCFIPKDMDGFLAAEKNISATRLANGATRLQPSTMLMGQAVGALASLAVRYKCPPRDIGATLVQRVLLDAGCLLYVTPFRDIPPDTALHSAAQLCAVHGYLTPENGWFHPDRELTKEDCPEILNGPHRSLRRGEAAFLIARALEKGDKLKLGIEIPTDPPACDSPSRAPTSVDVTKKYLTESTNWWMESHADFSDWRK